MAFTERELRIVQFYWAASASSPAVEARTYKPKRQRRPSRTWHTPVCHEWRIVPAKRILEVFYALSEANMSNLMYDHLKKYASE